MLFLFVSFCSVVQCLLIFCEKAESLNNISKVRRIAAVETILLLYIYQSLALLGKLAECQSVFAVLIPPLNFRIHNELSIEQAHASSMSSCLSAFSQVALKQNCLRSNLLLSSFRDHIIMNFSNRWRCYQVHVLSFKTSRY